MLQKNSYTNSDVSKKTSDMVEYVENDGVVIAVIIRRDYQKDGISFFTPSDFSQQIAYMKHPSGKDIQAHVHNQVAREVLHTKEVLFIKKGKLRVDFYSDQQKYLESRILQAGDVILLARGGHGFKVLEEVEMFEVKQGPYAGDQDKTRFQGINDTQVIIK